MSDNSKRPIQNFIVTILQLALAVIVMNVVLTMGLAKAHDEPINPVSAVSKITHQVWIDLKEGWSTTETKDTIK